MQELAAAGALLAAELLVFYILGTGLPYHREDGLRSVSENVLAGFFLYTGVFEGVAVVCTWLGTTLTTLCRVWAVILSVMTAASLVTRLGAWTGYVRWFRKHHRRHAAEPLLVLVALSYAFYSVCAGFTAEDSRATVSTMTTDMLNDTMSTVDPATGEKLAMMSPSVLLNRWPAGLSFLCRVSWLKPLTVTHFVTEALVVILSVMVLWRLFFHLFDGRKTKAFAAVLIAVAAEIFSRTVYTPSGLLEGCGWSGEAVFANIVVPAVLLLVLMMYEHDGKALFAHLFLAGIVAVGTCKWGILLYAVLLIAVMIPEMIAGRRGVHFLRMLACLVVPALGMTLCYFLPGIPCA